MKKICLMIISVLLCVCFFSSCTKEMINSLVDNALTVVPSSSIAAEASNNTVAPSASSEPVSSEEPASEEPVSEPEKLLSIDESYFELLGKTYEDLAAKCGEEKIYANMEFGLYASFESAGISALFDISMFERHYDSFSDWIADSNEFEFEDGYADSHYVGSRYSTSDFIIGNINIYGNDKMSEFFGRKGNVMLSMVAEYFGVTTGDVTENEMDGTYMSPTYKYGGHFVSFYVTPAGDDYIIDSVSLSSEDA